MKSYFSSDRFPKLDISFVIQSTNKNRNKPLGTAHAILSAQASVKGNFIVINADDYYGKEAFTLINEYYIYNNKPTTYSMVPYVLNETLSENGSVNRGICKIGENRILQEIEERINLKNDEIGPFWLNDYQVKQREDKEALVSMNLWALNESIFPKLEKKFAEFISNFHDDHTKEFQFPTVINQLINDGEIIVKVLDKGKDWMGITFSEDKEFVQANIKAKADLGEYPNPLF
jgi:UTP-glucose-1-phosphate uridylyltransferase